MTSYCLSHGRELRRRDRRASLDYWQKWVDADSHAAEPRIELVVDLIDVGTFKAIQTANIVLKEAEVLIAATDKILRGQLCYCHSMVKFQEGNWAEGLVALNYARQQFDGAPSGIALCDEAAGIYEMGMGNFADAQSNFEQSLAYHLEVDDAVAKGMSYYYLGRLYMLMDEPDMAADFIDMALVIGKEEPDRLLHLKAQIVLAEFWIYQQRYDTALELIEVAEELLRPEVDDLRRAYLWCDRAEALFGLGQYDRSLEVLKREATPQMREKQHPLGCAIAKELRGRVLLYRLMQEEGVPNEESLEAIEDIFLDASMVFEQQGMKRQFASTLYHLAQLYSLTTPLPSSYQYQGKRLRALELALSVLQQQPVGNGRLIAELERLMDESMGMGHP
ncbi:MAG: hypothetical protein HC919_02865 [Oscillatoriales cyanobacterium SM2_2_1]|nr:hypothetical protein [Oscillatoriales cyanobacterium SM2_2_1]